jgi:hypothetical protein
MKSNYIRACHNNNNNNNNNNNSKIKFHSHTTELEHNKYNTSYMNMQHKISKMIIFEKDSAYKFNNLDAIPQNVNYMKQ